MGGSTVIVQQLLTVNSGQSGGITIILNIC